MGFPLKTKHVPQGDGADSIPADAVVVLFIWEEKTPQTLEGLPFRL
jgi:hypothetical protein